MTAANSAGDFNINAIAVVGYPSDDPAKGIDDADNPKALRATLRRQGVMVTKLEEESAAAKRDARNVNFKRKLRRAARHSYEANPELHRNAADQGGFETEGALQHAVDPGARHFIVRALASADLPE